MNAVDALPGRVARSLAGIPLQGRRVVVGLSGGVDSMVLLEVMTGLAAPLGFVLGALHVHHGLSRNADAWAAFCADQCERRGIAFALERVTVARDTGTGREAAARAARYAAYARCGADAVALAHHLDDQAETVLLQALRGAGPHGLAGMPSVRPLGDALLLRPLLDVPRSAIEAFARARGLAWVEDESNADTAHSRNLLRAEILPRLERHYPGYRDSLARAARNAGEAAALADEVALADRAGVLQDDGLVADRLLGLGSARAGNVLRHWLREAGVTMPPRIRLAEAVRQLAGAPADAQPEIVLGTHVLRRYRGCIRLLPHHPEHPGWSVPWCGEADLTLPGGLRVVAHEGEGEGIARARLQGRSAVWCSRRGGERFQVAANRPRRELKKLFQEHGVAPWERDRLPLLHVDGHLAWVPGIGTDPAFAAAPGEASVRFEIERG